MKLRYLSYRLTGFPRVRLLTRQERAFVKLRDDPDMGELMLQRLWKRREAAEAQGIGPMDRGYPKVEDIPVVRFWLARRFIIWAHKLNAWAQSLVAA